MIILFLLLISWTQLLFRKIEDFTEQQSIMQLTENSVLVLGALNVTVCTYTTYKQERMYRVHFCACQEKLNNKIREIQKTTKNAQNT